MRGFEKNYMKRGQTNIYIHKLTSRLYERIGLRADSLKKNSKLQLVEGSVIPHTPYYYNRFTLKVCFPDYLKHIP